MFLLLSQEPISLSSSQEGPVTCLQEYASIHYFRSHVFLEIADPTYICGIRDFVPVTKVTCMLEAR